MRPTRYELRYFRLVRYEQLLASKHAPRWQRAGAADARSGTTKKLHYHTQHPRLDSMEGWCACIDITMQHEPQPENRHSVTGTRTRVARVRAEYPSQLDYSGCCINSNHDPLQQLHLPRRTHASAQQACPHSAANFQADSHSNTLSMVMPPRSF